MSDQSPGEQPPSDQPTSDQPPRGQRPRNRRPSAYSLGVERTNDRPPDEPPPSTPPAMPFERAYAAKPPRPARSGLSTLASLLGVLFAALVVAVAYLYLNPAANPVVAKDFAREQTRIAALTMQVQALSSRVEQVASRPTPTPPPPVDLKPLEDRIAALEQRPVPTPTPPVDLKPLEDKIAALEARPIPQPPPPVDLKPLEDKIAALEARPVPTPPPPAASPEDLAALSKRFDQLSAQQDAAAKREAAEVAAAAAALAKVQSGLTAAEQQASNNQAALTARLDKIESRLTAAEQQASNNQSAMTARLDKVDTRLSAVEHTTGQVAGLTATAQHLAKLQGAAAALDAGQPLGTIPDAPPALARFATKPPPTLSELRLSFPAAAAAAHQASQPAITQGQPFLDRLWARAQQAVTVREGTRVVLGDPVAGVLASAQHSLDAGDLSGAVLALDGLSGPAAAAIKPWRDQAQSLLDARAALAKLAATEG